MTLPKLPPRQRSDLARAGSKIAEALIWWNRLAEEANPPLARVTKLSPIRERSVRARLKEDEFDLEALRWKILASSFLQGRNGRGWRIDFDWIFRSSTNYLKILEGNYDDRQRDNGGREILTRHHVDRVAEIADRLDNS